MKRYLCAALRGFLYGVAGGEIQAALLMALPCGLVGAAYACLLQAARHAGHLHRREAV